MKLQIKSNNQEVINYYKEKQDKIQHHEGDSGFDLVYFGEDVTINPGETFKINFEIQCALLNEANINVSYLLVPRSSIIKTPIRQANSIGLIDAQYRGNIIAAVDNIKDKPYILKKGERLFQLVAPSLKPFTDLEFVDSFEETTRGDGGFGSTN